MLNEEERTRRRLEVHYAIREVLLRDWDPIGVSGLSGGDDEYDSYIPYVLGHLEGDSCPERIAMYLYEIATKRMCLRIPDKHEEMERLLRIVEKLKRIDITVPPCQ